MNTIYILVMFHVFPIFHEAENVYRGMVHEPTVIESLPQKDECQTLADRLSAHAQVNRVYVCIPVNTGGRQ